MSDVVIRDGRLPQDEPLFVRFVDALQAYEHAFQPNRRIDARAGADYLPVLLKNVREKDGRIFVAELGGEPVGWAVFHVDSHSNYVIAPEQRYGYIAELYLDAPARGKGLGRALIGRCEQEARAMGLVHLGIGVAEGNEVARRAYLRAGFGDYAHEMLKRL